MASAVVLAPTATSSGIVVSSPLRTLSILPGDETVLTAARPRQTRRITPDAFRTRLGPPPCTNEPGVVVTASPRDGSYSMEPALSLSNLDIVFKTSQRSSCLLFLFSGFAVPYSRIHLLILDHIFLGASYRYKFFNLFLFATRTCHALSTSRIRDDLFHFSVLGRHCGIIGRGFPRGSSWAG